jgi:hypothetical protein
MVQSENEDRDHWLLVVELSDDAGERRSPDLPLLVVIKTVSPPGERYEFLRTSESSPVGRFGTARRPDLEPAGPIAGSDAASAARRTLVAQLSAEGYTVSGQQDLWHVYVIRLHDAAGPRRNPAFPVVYVGQTSRTPLERFRQHVDGARRTDGHPIYSKVVRRHGIELMPDLYVDWNPIFSAEAARAAERMLADELREQGYTVRGGH